MAIRVAINHKTVYEYDRLVALSPNIFRLRPAVHSRIPIDAYSFKITPKEHFINCQQDPFGNYQARVVFPEKTTKLSVEVEPIANMVVINPFDFFLEKYAEKFPFVYSDQLLEELSPYLKIEGQGPLLQQYLSGIDRSEKTINDFLVYINQKLNRDIAYSIRMEVGVQTCEKTLELALGSCRDTGWLLVQLLRHLGLAARFVSGYLIQLTTDIKSLDGPSGPENDFTDLHAWAEVYVPGAGWIGLDPTSGLFAGEGHILLACTPHYASTAPVVGATDKTETTFSFSNIVTRIHEDPRVTKPYTDEQWLLIQVLGFKVDEDLVNGDVRMTMGGEPTFVSIDDMESEQWNTAADGKDKRLLSHDLIFRLRKQFGPKGMLHYGQGKWYPGEPLPRWQYGLFWRKDGYPVWKNTNLIAHERIEKKYTHEDAAKFIKELAKHLAVSVENVSTVYEDIYYMLWAEGRLPVNFDILKTNLKDSLERRTIAQVMEAGLDKPAGYVLPLRWNHDSSSWQSNKWIMKRGHMFVVPGSSPIGLRLPLYSLPAIPEGQEPEKVERSLFDELPEMANYHEIIQSRYGQVSEHPSTPEKFKFKTVYAEGNNNNGQNNNGQQTTEVEAPEKPAGEAGVIKTALCIEVREGVIYLFLPPIDYLENYLDLVASIEATSEKLQLPVRIEGYEPPRDYRMQRLVVSPDPGVIEVNIQPSKNWKELLHNINTLYDQVFLSSLATEKFMLDGRHTSTGGGNHITIGGENPSDSPLLRRPDLLRSNIAYWQHHPGLSYLFSSAFIRPTSQAPRADEGRDEKLYEMEIAFNQVPENGFIPFWTVDRIFRHLLTDITGNTHRAELCIDKLYSPDSSSGRLGILEFRAFDMPPHKQMSLVQMLLIRSLVAMFWKKPYNHKLVRWGTELQDKFMLPHFVQTDIKDIVQDLNDAGYAFQLDWFNPFLEFRFPHYGTLQLQGIEMEIRMAIEPWHVLGEEMSGMGTARFVNSSLERIQVNLKGMNGTRYVIMCNGNRVHLVKTGVKGEFVDGVRYRAWQPPSALHPTIGIDTPLTFDIIDSWNSRSIGGCTYYVTHLGGRCYDRFPVNSYEAESRRGNRFWEHGHTQGVLPPSQPIGTILHYIEQNRMPFLCDPPSPLINEEYPFTLDMRQFWNK